MADEKTEQPTAKRLRDSREKGDVPKSQEVPSAVVVTMIVAYFLVAAPNIFALLYHLVTVVIDYSFKLSFSEAWPRLSGFTLLVMLKICAPVVAVSIFAALVGNLIQIGFLFAPKAAMPKLDNINPQKWFKKVFSKKNAFDFIKNVLKVAVLSLAVWMALQGNVRQLFVLPYLDESNIWPVMSVMLKELVIYAVVSFLVIAIMDFIYTRLKYTKDHMMSIDEVKREFKESEGDPQIKQKRKQLHQEMANQNTLGKTRKAKVLVVNPTHYAVAIDYDPETTPLPTILAKGEGDLARRMIEVAK
ncbi:MAG: EscU/YscU/HrcU family type III secretion system export apparatus switch protein, partial [Succinivibrio sp.]|nr:EscU/YscU/HrcU family type III secretion system export apparatus switch protein [Succinivibrio sp.]